MTSGSLSFSCPACGTRLNVPRTMAGVEGPCPACRAIIRAPQAVAPPPPAPQPLPVMPELPRPEPGSKIRPEPRLLPERPPIPPIEPRHRTDDDVLKQRNVEFANRRRGGGRMILRLIVPVFFLAAVAATVYFSARFFFFGERENRAVAEAAAPAPKEARPEEAPQQPAVDDVGELLKAVGADVPPTPVVESPEPKKSAEAQVLEAFLAAPDAGSRVPLVEPAADEETLGAGLLAGVLPPVALIEPESSRFYEAENLTEFPFLVTFQPEGGEPFQCAAMVRRTGENPPKVFLPAFLDLLPGCRLAAFAAAPVSGLGVFHAVLEARSGCYDEGVPAPEKKFTFRLLSGPLGTEIARAYVTDSPRFRGMLEDPESSLRWGTRVRATAALRWNHNDDPQKPYLELMEIRALGWNP